jgi:hypothetical protein
MKSLVFLSFLALFIAPASNAFAEGKVWIWGWGPSHWESLDYEPYLQNGKHPHNSQWDEIDWKTEYWEEQRSSELQVIRGFYFSDIIRNQYIEDDIPVMVVGPNFYKLSGYDKQRVTEMVDEAYGITASSMFGSYKLYDWSTEKPIGLYTRYGLQIQ